MLIFAAVWIRFFPIVLELQRLVHEEKIIGEPYRMFCDFGLELHLENLPPVSHGSENAVLVQSITRNGILSRTSSQIVTKTPHLVVVHS